MAGSRARTRSQVVQSDNQLLSGIQKHYPSATFNTRSGPVTAAQVADAVNGRSSTAQAVVAAKTAYHAAVVAEEQEVAQTEALLTDVRQSILAMFPSPQILSDCGVAARKPPRPLTPQQKVVRAAKAKATRLARGTMSAKQKALIKGAVPATLSVATDGSAATATGGGSGTAPAVPASPAATSGASNGASNGASTGATTH